MRTSAVLFLAAGLLFPAARDAAGVEVGPGVGLNTYAVFEAITQVDPPEGNRTNVPQEVPGRGSSEAQSISALAMLPSSVWNLTGTASARIGSMSATETLTGTLTLNGDRTYVLQADGDPVPETGVWFQDRNKILLFQQNILEQILALEADLAADAGEPVELALLRSGGKVSINSRTGVLSIKADARFNVFLPQSNLTLRLSTSAKVKGTRVP